MDLEARVEIHPANLNNDIKSHIATLLNMNFCKTLTSQGYIKKINYISQISGGKITSASNGSVIYHVKYNADVYSVTTGEIVKAIVQDISSYSMSCKGYDAPEGIGDFFVPESLLDGKEYKKNDIVFLKVEALRINKYEYTIICSISEPLEE